jgi:hypothetical protein
VSRLWRDHSLSIVLTVFGFASTFIGAWFVWPLEAERWFDLSTGVGAGFLTVAAFNWLSGPLRERNRPEV